MKFDTPATTNPIDQLKVVGKPADRIDGPLKTTGTAPYAYERHDVAPNAGLRLRRRRRRSPRAASRRWTCGRAARRPACSPSSPRDNAGKLGKGDFNTAKLLGGPEIEHYHQAIALVVAETFEQARAAAQLVRVEYERAPGAFDLAAAKDTAQRREASRFARPAGYRRSATSPAPSPRRRCSSTRPTRRPTSRTR